MKGTIKTFYFGLCAFIARVIALFGWSGGPVVLMYHAINIEGGKLSVSPDVFHRHMEFLRTHRTLVSLGDVLSHYRGEKILPANAVAVSIDDGYLDTYREAFPILKEFKIPFTLFLTTDLRVMSVLANLPRPTWDQIREMSAVGLMTLGLHGHQHLHVTEIGGDTEALDRELKFSVETITKETGKTLSLYAYAFGARDLRIPLYLKTIGIEAAFGITDGVVGKKRDIYAFPRVQIDRTMSPRLFRYRTTPGVEIAFLLKQFLRKRAH
jgi:peptidoglycan/xylan/chitin deacetylase (PgdA/CDA1 family)